MRLFRGTRVAAWKAPQFADLGQQSLPEAACTRGRMLMNVPDNAVDVRQRPRRQFNPMLHISLRVVAALRQAGWSGRPRDRPWLPGWPGEMLSAPRRLSRPL